MRNISLLEHVPVRRFEQMRIRLFRDPRGSQNDSDLENTSQWGRRLSQIHQLGKREFHPR